MSDHYESMTREELIAALRRVESAPEESGAGKARRDYGRDPGRAHVNQPTLSPPFLHESRNRHVDPYDCAPVGYVTLDPHGTIREINQTGSRLFGLDKSELVGRPLAAHVAPADRSKFQEHLRRCRAQGSPIVSEVQLETAEGQAVPTQMTSSGTEDPSGNGELYPTVIIDLTERKAAEKEIRAGAERLQLAQAAGGVGIWEFNLETGELQWSEEKSRLFGIPHRPDLISYETWKKMIHPDDRGRIEALVQGKSRENDFEYRIVRPDGQVRWIVSRGRALSDASSSRMVGVTLDITESKQIQARLQELNEALAERTREAEERSAQLGAVAAQLTQAENRERRRLALLLHDGLQQLLIALRMKIALIKHQPRSHSVESLLAQSGKLLDEAITASRSLSVELSPPMLYDSGLPAALEWLAEQMQEKHALQVSVQTSDEPEEEDIRIFLFQCVRELLFNVVKHAESRRAEVSMSRLGDDQIQIVVRDFGKGLDPSTVFQSRESFGLLSIRERLNWLGGRFEIETAPGAGTRAILVAPVRKPRVQQGGDKIDKWLSQPPKLAGPRPSGSSIRILVVDDHAVVRQGLTSLLEGEPDLKIVAQASDGQTAVNCAKTLPVDVVLMDFSMPGMNGAETTRRIHEVKPNLPVIGMSVYEEQSIAEAMRKAGAAAFFRKDDPSEGLVSAIRSLCRTSVGAEKMNVSA